MGDSTPGSFADREQPDSHGFGQVMTWAVSIRPALIIRIDHKALRRRSAAGLPGLPIPREVVRGYVRQLPGGREPVPCHNSHHVSELVFSVSIRLLFGTR